MGFVVVTAVISGLFFTEILEFTKRDIGITLIAYCIYAIVVCCWYDELHILEEKLVNKCFYYE